MPAPEPVALPAPLRLSWPPLLRSRLSRRLKGASVALIAPLLALLAWQASAVAGWLPPQVLPGPAEVGALFVEMLDSGELLDHTRISLGRVAGGFALGAAGGMALGVAMGMSPRLEGYVNPLFVALAQIPPLGWVPLLIMLVGIDETLKVLVIAKAAFVPLVINTLKGIRAIPAAYVEVGRVFAFGPRAMLARVVLPAAVPPVFTGVRYGLTHAWLALVAVELLASSEGLGYLMVWGRQLFQLETVLVAMVVVGAIGWLMDRLLEAAEARLQRWRLAGTPAEGMT